MNRPVQAASALAGPGSVARRGVRHGGRGVASATVLLVAVHLAVPSAAAVEGDALAARVDSILVRRGLGPDALRIIDNVVRHEAPPPPAAPAPVRELLAQPLAAVDVAALFDRTVPLPLREIAGTAAPGSPAGTHAGTVSVDALLVPLIDGLADAQRMLRSAAGNRAIDEQGIIVELATQPPGAERLRGIEAGVDAAAVDRAAGKFIDAIARFTQAVRGAGATLRFPDKAVRFDSAIGAVVIGTRGNDVHGPDAALIVDPGGDDTYERAPATGGAVSVIIDLGGNDRYRGSDVAVNGFSAILDFSGDDRYTMTGPGLGAAVVGASLLVDFSGNDEYAAGFFAQGAAAYGFAALVDLRGDDRYRVGAGGQGFGLAGGVALLWDRAGNDHYTAGGLADAFGRGGGLSAAQGAAFGFRTMLGGGIGILRDDAGDDTYEAEMFAQGIGFYYGVGVLWDRGGNDIYRAVRYAQGNGVHEAVGVLRDESGDDRYALAVGVGQGMGLDLAVGVLADGGGDDSYRSPVLAQGTATANGIGIVIDGGGADRWETGPDPRSWGHAEWSRGLPSVGLLVYDAARAVFMRAGEALPQPPDGAAFGGPAGSLPAAHERVTARKCPDVAPAAEDAAPTLAEALARIVPGFGGGALDVAAYAQVRRLLRVALEAGIAELPRDSFNVAWALGEALYCALAGATEEEAREIRTGFERMLSAEPETPFAGAMLHALRARPLRFPEIAPMLDSVDAHPRCGVRAAALSLRLLAADDGAARAAAAARAQTALRSPCWRLQAAAYRALAGLGARPGEDAVVASFLRNPSSGQRGAPQSE